MNSSPNQRAMEYGSISIKSICNFLSEDTWFDTQPMANCAAEPTRRLKAIPFRYYQRTLGAPNVTYRETRDSRTDTDTTIRLMQCEQSGQWWILFRWVLKKSRVKVEFVINDEAFAIWWTAMPELLNLLNWCSVYS